MKQRKIPLRKCIVTNEMKPKGELIRIVRTPEGTVELDPTGKKNGRGATYHTMKMYLSWRKKEISLTRHLQVNVTAEVYDQLLTDLKKVKKK
ncbi:LOW QUALITY PROTEIN: nucleic-acid-binding protein implicated in transcription termination [Bacillus sp. JCM 19047]|nr:LOW QUALITY PROTEIN: nucleic-acid-binding protein implicated in transcription termination [Bacillus sp. JCM 19047]